MEPAPPPETDHEEPEEQVCSDSEILSNEETTVEDQNVTINIVENKNEGAAHKDSSTPESEVVSSATEKKKKTPKANKKDKTKPSTIPKRKRGRPRGSRNKKRPRGRPRINSSKQKPKNTLMNYAFNKEK